jgi:hypothetical protein
VQRGIDNLVRAVKAGILTPTTTAELEKAEAERARLERELKIDARPIDDIEAMLSRAIDHHRALVTNLEKAVSRETNRARTTRATMRV